MQDMKRPNPLQPAFEVCDALKAALDVANAKLPHTVDPDFMSEAIPQETFNNPCLMAQFLMNAMDWPLEADPITSFSEHEKEYWMKAAFHMGPDWLAKLRKVVAWMEKVEGWR